MKQTDVNVYYQLGASIGYLFGGNLRTGQDSTEAIMNMSLPRTWLHSFLRQTEDVGRYLKDSRDAARAFLKLIEQISTNERILKHDTIAQDECVGLFSAKEKFEQCLERETKTLMVFTVTPKGAYDTAVLLSAPEEELPDRLHPELPPTFLADLGQAARCLLFDIPVGCAFHVCRATESLMLAYYEKLAKKKWSLAKRDWNTYIQHLTKEGAPADITTRLNEIRAMNRNPYIHPELDVSAEEAQVLYKLCAGVNYYMADEMTRLP